jgi:hypothetical protein
MRARIVTAFFGGPLDAERAAARLLAAGAAAHDVRLYPKIVTRADEVGVRVATRSAEGAAAGALAGGALGAALGAAFAGGALVLPGVGVVFAGAWVAALAGAGLVGAVATAIGAAIGARMPLFEAAYLPDAVRMGGALMTVRCADRDARRLRSELARSGARVTAVRVARA